MLDNQLLLFKLITDSGLLILIWLVQLIIYPGFRYYKPEQLTKWHGIYTGRITMLVLPLMLSQLILSIWIAFEQQWSMYCLINLILVAFTWVITFTTFVPLHQKIDFQNLKDKSPIVDKLVSYNWLRTFIWTLILILTVYNISP